MHNYSKAVQSYLNNIKLNKDTYHFLLHYHILSKILVTVGSFLRAFKLFWSVFILSEMFLLLYSTSLGSPKLSKIVSLFSSLKRTIWRVSCDCFTKKNPIIFGTLSFNTWTTILKYPFNLSLISLMNNFYPSSDYFVVF